MKNEAKFRIATIDDLNKRWDKEIKDRPNDKRWLKWKDEYIKNNIEEKCKTFVVEINGEVVGQATLILNPSCSAVKGKPLVCDGKNIANVDGLRIDKEFQNNGYSSQLLKIVEDYAKQIGLDYLTIGVLAKETKNLKIYMHWGFDEFIIYEIENDELVLYYGKKLD